MRNNKYSRLKLYIITTFVAFVVSSAITTFFLVRYRNDYLQSAISYANEISPVNISIKNVSIEYPLRIVLNDFKVYSKTNTNKSLTVINGEFLSIPSLSIFFNPFKIFVGRGIFYCISDVYISDAYLYPNIIDNNFFTNSVSNDSASIKTKIQDVLYIFEGKNIRVDNFNVDIVDGDNEHTRIALQYMRADLKGPNYNFDTALYLQEETDIRLSLILKKDMSYLESKLLVNNKRHPILNCYINSSIDANNIITVDLKNSSNENLGYINYDHQKKNAEFNISNVIIKKENIISFYEAVSSIPLLQKIPVNNSVSSVVEEFANINLYANGKIKNNEILNFDMNVSSKADKLDLDFDVKITNKIAYSTNFYMHFENARLNADFKFPINNPKLIDANIQVFDFNIDTNSLSLDLSLKPVFSNDKRVVSRLSINSLSYIETIKEPLFFDIEYVDKNNLVNVNIVTNDFIKPYTTTIYLSKESEVKVVSYGRLNKDILTPFLGRSKIDALNSSMDIDYKLHNTNNYLVNDLNLTFKKMYSEEEIAIINVSAYSNKIVLKNMDYNLGSNLIRMNFDASYNKNGEIELEGNLESPIGNQKIIASLKNSNSVKLLDAYSDDGMFQARGNISSNGNVDINLGTTKTTEINDIAIDTKISINNTIKTNGKYSIWGYFRAEKQKYSVFNLSVYFETSHNSLLFTNISYSYRDISINGNAVISVENNIITLDSSLKDIHSSGYFNTSFTLNKDNIFGNIDMADMQLAFGVGESDIYGVVNTKITVMGILTEPIIHVNNFSIKDLEVPGYKFDVSLSGDYKKEELELTNISIIKTGQNGYVVSQSANRIEQITIPRAYFSKDVHSLSMNIANLKLVSTLTAKIDYSMKKQLNGDYEYSISSGPIKINKRKIPAFRTIATYNRNNLMLIKSIGSHGIDGIINNSSSNMAIDIVYLFDNKDFLNVEGNIKQEKTNQVDLMCTSSEMDVEIFEFFNNLFTSITAAKTNFTLNDKEYTLNARVHGDIDNLQIDGRFLGRGSKIKLRYFSETFVDTDVDVLFEGHKIKVGTLEFYTKKNKWIKLTGEAEFIGNIISFMDFDILSSDEQVGLLYADADIGILRSKGPSHIDLNMTGSLQNPRLTGAITLIKNDVELTMGPENVYTERVFGVVSRQYFDLTVQALRGIRVVHNLVGDVSIENGSSMYVIGSKEQGINLQGTINFERGNIYYLQNIYTIERGSVTFPDVNSLDPIINTTAYTYTKYIPPAITTIVNPNSDAYNVTLYMEMDTRVSQILFNTSANNLPVRFYTIPTLGQSQVNQLAGINTSTTGDGSRIYEENNTQANETSMAINQQLQEQTIQAYGDLLLRNFALRPVERWARQFIGIDYISFSPTLAKNFLFREDVANRSFFSVLDETSVSIGKYTSKDLYFKYDVTYRFNDPERPILLNKSKNPYYFEHQFGFEVSLLRDFNLANFLFEYRINPFDMNIIKQEFNVLLRWRL